MNDSVVLLEKHAQRLGRVEEDDWLWKFVFSSAVVFPPRHEVQVDVQSRSPRIVLFARFIHMNSCT